MSEGTPEVDQFASDIFNSSSVETTDSGEGALSSWDDAEAYEAPATEPQEEVADELNPENENQAPEEGDTDIEPTEAEDSDDSDKDDSQDEEEGEQEEQEAEAAPLEIPEQLAEKGLVANEEGEVGKMVKIDGEDTFVPLSELGNDYSGQKALQQRFTEFDRKEKEYQSEVAEVEKYVDVFAEKMKTGDALAAMSYLGEFSGIAPYQIKRQLIEQLAPEIERMAEMSGPELQAQYAKEENEYLKQTLESEREGMESKQAQEELSSHIQSVRETHGIEDSEWDQAITYLQEHEEHLRAQNPELVMDAEFVADFVMDQRAYGRAEGALEDAGVNLSDDGVEELLGYLQDTAYRNPDFTQDDLVELVKVARKQAVESKVSESLGKRVQKHGNQKKPKGEPSNNHTTPEEDALLEDIWG